MIVLTVNCGSSSVKCRVFDATNHQQPAAVRVLAEGSVGGVPEDPVMVLRTEAGDLRKAIAVDDDAGGVRHLLRELTGAFGLSRIEADGQNTEGSWHSPQVPIGDVADNVEHLRLLKEWLKRYQPEELFDGNGALRPEWQPSRQRAHAAWALIPTPTVACCSES